MLAKGLLPNVDQPLPIYIGGEWRLGSGPLYHTLYPASGETVATLHAATADDVETAIQMAQYTFEHSGWAQRLPHERATVLYKPEPIFNNVLFPQPDGPIIDTTSPLLMRRLRSLTANAVFGSEAVGKFFETPVNSMLFI